MNYRIFTRSAILTLLLVFLVAGRSSFAEGSQFLYFEGPSSSIAPESYFTASIFLYSKDPVNAFDLKIVFPQDQLKFLSFDNADSIVDLWQAAHVFPEGGSIQLTGALFKSFSGEKGQIVKISFQAIKEGDVKISFEKSNIYLADGKGEEISADNQPMVFSVIKISNQPISGQPVWQDLLKKILLPLLAVILIIFVIWLYRKKSSASL